MFTEILKCQVVNSSSSRIVGSALGRQNWIVQRPEFKVQTIFRIVVAFVPGEQSKYFVYVLLSRSGHMQAPFFGDDLHGSILHGWFCLLSFVPFVLVN